METRERPRDPRERRLNGIGPGGSIDLGAQRAEADRLLAAADDAIERALSEDSTAFVARNRQRGGQ